MKLNLFLKILLLAQLAILSSCSSSTSDNVELSSGNLILSFELSKDSYSKGFSISNNGIEGTVDSSVDLTGITLNVTISQKATITPEPSSIKSISGPFTFTVVAENGDERVYNISISRELSKDNSIQEFRIITENFETNATINDDNGTITQRLPQTIDLSNLEVSAVLADRATVDTEIDTLFDFSGTVSITVTSESGDQKTYDVSISHMDESFSATCNEMNASKWFGGDNRTFAPDIDPFDRNVGTGQVIVLEKDIAPTSFSAHLADGFRFEEDGTPYMEAVELKLNIRNSEGEIIATTTTNVPGDFDGGFIPFDLTSLNLFLENETEYIFQWYLINGEVLGVSGSSPGTTVGAAEGFCFGSGYSGQAKLSEETSLEDFDVWWEHPWYFNIQLEGNQ